MIEAKQGPGDDSAMVKIQGWCTDGSLLNTLSDQYAGDWTDWYECPAGYAICAFKLRIESPQGSGALEDDTALNGISVACCSLPAL
jgi:hypothetical protein